MGFLLTGSKRRLQMSGSGCQVSGSRRQVLGLKRRCQVLGARCQVCRFQVSRCQVPGVSIRKSKLWIDFYTFLYQIFIPSVKDRVITFRRCFFQKLFWKYVAKTHPKVRFGHNCITSTWVNLLHIQACKNLKKSGGGYQFAKTFGPPWLTE